MAGGAPAKCPTSFPAQASAWAARRQTAIRARSALGGRQRHRDWTAGPAMPAGRTRTASSAAAFSAAVRSAASGARAASSTVGIAARRPRRLAISRAANRRLVSLLPSIASTAASASGPGKTGEAFLGRSGQRPVGIAGQLRSGPARTRGWRPSRGWRRAGRTFRRLGRHDPAPVRRQRHPARSAPGPAGPAAARGAWAVRQRELRSPQDRADPAEEVPGWRCFRHAVPRPESAKRRPSPARKRPRMAAAPSCGGALEARSQL